MPKPSKNPKYAIIVITIIVLFLFTIFFSILEKLPPDTWYVDAGGSEDFTSIQDAINGASSGDKIIVKDGTYIENLYVNKSLTIRSENGNENCKLKALDSTSPIFYVASSYSEISGFTITGAKEGFGILINGVDHCYISDNNISNNSFGIYLNHARSGVDCFNPVTRFFSSNNKIKNNIVSGNYGGIWLNNSINNNIEKNVVLNNEYGITPRHSSNNNIIRENTVISNKKYGLVFYNSSSNLVKDNNISNNYYGIYISGGINCYNTINDNQISNNNDSGISIWGGYSCYNVIRENTALNNRYGIFLKGKSILHNSITDNNASSNREDGIHMTNSDENDIEYNIFNSNQNYGIYLNNSKNNKIRSNTALNNKYNFYSDGSNNKIDNNKVD